MSLLGQFPDTCAQCAAWLLFPGGALTNIEKSFHYTHDGPSTAAAAMRGTCDVECDTVYKNYLAQALSTGAIDLLHVRDSARRLLKHRMRLGLFDPIGTQAVTKLADPAVVHGPAHVQLAHEAAVQSLVLLQNPAAILPLDLAATNKKLGVRNVFGLDFRRFDCLDALPNARFWIGRVLSSPTRLIKVEAPRADLTCFRSCPGVFR